MCAWEGHWKQRDLMWLSDVLLCTSNSCRIVGSAYDSDVGTLLCGQNSEPGDCETDF